MSSIDEQTTLKDAVSEIPVAGLDNGGTLFRQNMPLILDSLSLADNLFDRVQSLRSAYTKLTKESLPALEAITSYESVERDLVKPHRERMETLQQEVRMAREQREAELRDRTIQLLRSNIALDTCLRLVNTLKQQRDFIERPEQLMKTFLAARSQFITTLIEDTIVKRPHVDDLKQFDAILKIMKEPVLEVVTQFQAIFTESHLLGFFVIERLSWFLDSLRIVVGRAKNTLVLASFWNQLVLLNAGYVSVGASFLPLVEGMFVERAIQLIRVTAASSFKHFQGKLTLTMMDMKPAAAPLRPLTRQLHGKEIQPGTGIAEHPALLLAFNVFADVFEHVCMFAISPLRAALSTVIEEQIVAHEALYIQSLGEERAAPLVEMYRREVCPFVRTQAMEAYFGS